ncbi:Ubiquitin-conjugating enzyme [Thalictrum thalictroides]|uniref:Ubiquitin-conjugating enzyme n=1 Tax=Thalictrum thalictroides TaxID=46969 RepID=A0A7J6VWY8_THATH|nr:Ubiquitin-conjugating enzyme [Thalictrum thalictroides]
MTNFKPFDIVRDASDHHFLGSNHNGKDCKDKVMKTIMKEWKILEQNLPESIFVRVYEERIDLLRAAIVGPPFTPYYNGLFFFDFCFPKDYPARPPTVYYHSFGLRLNPNLYSNGYVCLSLLNTWNGQKVEKWNKSQSTVLQVLLSLQALVLNEKPCFNEPGIRSMAGKSSWEKRSLAYNEETWVKSCKTMIFLLHTPRKHFEEFIIEHFREQAQTILLACKAYMSGYAKVGDIVQDETSSSPAYKASKQFNTSMLDIYPRLLDYFASKGASVENCRIELKVLPKPEDVAEKRKDGISKKMFITLKMLFGCAKVVEHNDDTIRN